MGLFLHTFPHSHKLFHKCVEIAKQELGISVGLKSK